MTLRLNPARQCHGKATFSSKAEAKRFTKRVGGTVAGFDILHAYRCPHCGSFHLGHHKPELRERLRTGR